MGAGVLVILALLTWDRLPAWQSDRALWEATVRSDPSPIAWLNYGAALASTGDHRGALMAYQKAEEAFPTHPLAQGPRAEVFLKVLRLDQARSCARWPY